MNKTIKSILAGIVAGAITVCTLPVIANSIDALMNSVNINLNGKKVASVNESYVLQNGEKVPFSILYEGTTYLPIRKVSELLDITIDWDNPTRTVLIDTAGSSVAGYDPWYGAPDFGKVNNIKELDDVITVNSTSHWYDIKKIGTDFEDKYIEELEKLGYERITDGVKSKFKVYGKGNIEVWLDLSMYTKFVYGITVIDTTRPLTGRDYSYGGSKENIPLFDQAFGYSGFYENGGYYYVGEWDIWSSIPSYILLLEQEGFSISNVNKGYYGKAFTFKNDRTTVTLKFDGTDRTNLAAFIVQY